VTWRKLTDDDVEHASRFCRCEAEGHHSTLEEEAGAFFSFHRQHAAEDHMLEKPLSVFGRVLKTCECGTLETLDMLGGCNFTSVEVDLERGLARVTIDWDGMQTWAILNKGSTRRGVPKA
jgi:hypothetical protein